MTEDQKHRKEERREPGSDGKEASPPLPFVAPSDGADAQVTQLQGELEETKNSLLRAMADYQNFARRTQRDIGDARLRQLAEVAKALVPVLDHFDRALDVDPKKTSVEALLQGVQMVRGELAKMLEHFDVKRLDAKPGDVFDPARHEAMMKQKVQGIEAGHIAAQMQPGYLLGDKVIRAAKVAVAE